MSCLRFRPLIGIIEIESLKAEERTVVRSQGIVSIPNRDYRNLSTSDLYYSLCYYSMQILFRIKNFLSLIIYNFHGYILKLDTNKYILYLHLSTASQIDEVCSEAIEREDQKILLKLNKLENVDNIRIGDSEVTPEDIIYLTQVQIPHLRLCYSLEHSSGIQTLYISRVKEFLWLISCELYILFFILKDKNQNAKPESRSPPDCS